MEKSTEEAQSVKGIPLKVVDLARECKKGVVASTLQELISRARGKLGVPDNVPVKIVLEQDGTEVDDDEYFSTVEKNTVVMLLKNDEKWLPPGKFHRVRRISDETDGPRFGPKDKELSSLVDRLQGDLTHISMLGGRELELLSNMDPESLIDIFPESEIFLVQLKEASGRFLSEKRQAQEALELLKLYRGGQQEEVVQVKKEKV
ncbi:DNA fragmentation factor subunit alpha-like isoform X2 [Schistocerca nitens]|uniref:DNA fragmentation factor subunit alpha-like isoform X2 n=1 Tax=Schistocerca nitens TaxID=7011 RepID=UPI002119392B|nr:DNA fragmentation factor subunit alpha-like isoform X2 [Schistocerca nitens]XP_049805544.1 DNA fragmentation factor subunit alpha-like isoform X2 [Schistocerca nitens]XP_049847463.1 DNA fragmentation factor subunit alpha-like isoform X2 [Schistocerca gregaria]XP_049847464.1 DNA fragmentation factor subunit alpha-like isoform X2 [Schistocerca gregaria]XP_049847465.1 DNA fragmentation factor subunit alpha-like isoform X2 [Schistocerca gregaria]XP_049847466.1 DNA fragmentation factor subunit a